MTASKALTNHSWVDPDDAPELTGKELSRRDGRWHIGGQRVSTAKGRAAFRAELGKQKVNMMLDNAVVRHFKRLAGGRGYQTLINTALREAMERENLENLLRRIVRDELRQRR